MSSAELNEWQLIDDEECLRAAQVLEIVGKRWAGGILLAMARGAERFSDIRASVRGLSGRLLAVRLRELEAAELVEREILHTMPVGIRYQLSAQGRDLLASLQPIARYTGRWPSAGARTAERLPGER